MQTISIRLDDKAITKIEELRGSEHKSDFYRKLIERALNTFEHKEITPDNKAITSDCALLQAKNKNLEELVKSKDQTITVLEKQNGFLISEFQKMSSINERLLMPSQEEQKEKGKKWFEFWK